MSEVKKTTHMPITVEVANAGHVEKALANNVDVLWIGARNKRPTHSLFKK
jgi:chorismate mutase